MCEYSKIYEIFNGQFVQPDWLQGALIVAKEALWYYTSNKVQTNGRWNYVEFFTDFINKFENNKETTLLTSKRRRLL